MTERRDDRGRQRGAARSDGRVRRSAQAPASRARSGDPARGAAFDVLREVAASDAYANLVLPPLLTRRRIVGRDAAFATELTYGTLRLRGRYDAILDLVVDRGTANLDPAVLDALRLGTHQLLGMRVPAHAAVSQTVALTRDRVGAGPAQLVNAVLRRVAEHPVDDWLNRAQDAAGDDVNARLAVRWSHPAWVVRALREALVGHGRSADELEDLLAADDEAPRVTLVARPGMVDADELMEQVGAGASRGALAQTAVVLPGGAPAQLPAVQTGQAGVQDEGSQLVALLLAHAPLDGPDARWLDLCAGPGGKTALLGAVAAGRGAQVRATEVQQHRTDLVVQAVRALPEGTVDVGTADGRQVGEHSPEAYDRVLVDAPCTGLGALRRRPESRWRRLPTDLAPLGALQRDLVASAFRAVRVGGIVGYVTCSPHLAETLSVVLDATRAAARAGITVEVVHPSGALAALGVDPGDLVTPAGAIQLWPHLHGTDAMSLTLLRRTA
jgi:16S rRNA (cytosine967-C5)-methyltransferase